MSSTFDLQDYLYHVLWTADGEIIFSSQIVEYSQRNLTNLRTANFDEEGLDKLGTLVYCLHFFKTFFKILEIYITNMSVEYFV